MADVILSALWIRLKKRRYVATVTSVRPVADTAEMTATVPGSAVRRYVSARAAPAESKDAAEAAAEERVDEMDSEGEGAG